MTWPMLVRMAVLYDLLVGESSSASLGEVACLVKDECHSTNTPFHGNDETAHEVATIHNDAIVALWLSALGLTASPPPALPG